jgi:hypothetical protein
VRFVSSSTLSGDSVGLDLRRRVVVVVVVVAVVVVAAVVALALEGVASDVAFTERCVFTCTCADGGATLRPTRFCRARCSVAGVAGSVNCSIAAAAGVELAGAAALRRVVTIFAATE